MMNGWNNKRVLITGAGSGIGLAIAKRALSQGALVSAFLRTLNDEIQSLSCSTLLISQGDVTNLDDLKQCVEVTRSKFNTIDVIINNAGAMYYMDITKPNHQHMRSMIETNCLGFINLIEAGLPELLQAKQGHWINITSDAGKRPFPGLAIYSGTKAFIEFSASAMRQELISHGIKVTNIQPGNVQTPLHKKSTDKAAISRFATIDNGQYLAAEDIVQAIEYAISTPFHVAVNELLVEPLTESI